MGNISEDDRIYDTVYTLTFESEESKGDEK